jgi:hypothetical protein
MTYVEEGVDGVAVSRRLVLIRGCALFGFAAALSATALCGGSASANSGKIPQREAKYNESSRGSARCDKCLQFQPPSTCKIVDGAISPSGSCNFFAPRAN